MCAATWVGPETNTNYIITCTYKVGPFESKKAVNKLEPFGVDK